MIYADKTILCTGGTGSFGNACIRKLLSDGIKKVIVFSRDEKKQWDMAQEIKDSRVRYFLGDVRDKERLERAFHGVDEVIHAAALKQVPALEYNPIEAVKTNILGTQNIINAAIDQGVKKVLMLSTDKAVNPINLYGATKLCAEKLMLASNAYGGRFTKFSVVRYGNVMGSRGSVIEVFNKQKESGVLTLTHSDMTRFKITLDSAVEFVLRCLQSMQGAEIFIPKLDKIRIKELAEEICPVCEIKEIGIRPGEKVHEVLLSKDESRYTEEKDDCFIVRQGEIINTQPFIVSSS